jgi:hypothetical protein
MASGGAVTRAGRKGPPGNFVSVAYKGDSGQQLALMIGGL